MRRKRYFITTIILNLTLLISAPLNVYAADASENFTITETETKTESETETETTTLNKEINANTVNAKIETHPTDDEIEINTTNNEKMAPVSNQDSSAPIIDQNIDAPIINPDTEDGTENYTIIEDNVLLDPPVDNNHNIFEEKTDLGPAALTSSSLSETDNVVVEEQATLENLHFTTLAYDLKQYHITATGNMPENATLSVTERYDYAELAEKINEEGYNIDLALDIEIIADGIPYQPLDFNQQVQISISDTNLQFTDDTIPQVYRILDADDIQEIQDNNEHEIDEITLLSSTINEEDDIVFSTDHFTTYTFGNKTITVDGSAAYLMRGIDFNIALKNLCAPEGVTCKLSASDNHKFASPDESLSGKEYMSYFINWTITDIQWTDTNIGANPEAINLSIAGEPVYACKQLNKDQTSYHVLLYTPADVVYFNADSSCMFNELSGLITVSFLSEKIDTSLCTDMSDMFSGRGLINTIRLDTLTSLDMQLAYIDLSRFCTTNVTNMSYMFSGMNRSRISSEFRTAEYISPITKPLKIDVSTFDTGQVRNMGHMFADNEFTELQTGPTWNTHNVNNFEYMFDRCFCLELDAGILDFHNATSIRSCFQFVGKVYNFENLDVANVADFSYVFSGVEIRSGNNLDESILDLSQWNMSQATTMEGICQWVKCDTITFGHQATSQLTTLADAFYGTSCEKMDVTGLDTSHVTNMERTFYCCYNLVKLDLSTWDTSHVITLVEMFDCYSSKLKALYLDNFDISQLPADKTFALHDLCALQLIRAPKKINATQHIVLPGSQNYWFLDDEEPLFTADAKRVYTELINNISTSHTYIRNDCDDFALPGGQTTLLPGEQFNIAIKSLINTSATSVTHTDNTITSIAWVDTPWANYQLGQNIAQPGTTAVYARSNPTAVDLNSTYATCGRKVAHTAHISDDGTWDKTDCGNLNNLQTITIPGATALHISIRCSLDPDSANEHIYVFQGRYADSIDNDTKVKANSQYIASLSDCGTVEVDHSDFWNTNYHHLSPAHEYDVVGDTATIGIYVSNMFRSFTDNYAGYYAVVEGRTYPVTKANVELYSEASNVYLNADCSDMFTNFSVLESIDIFADPFTNIKAEHTTNMSNMFSGCNSLQNLNFANLNLDAVTQSDEIFMNTTNLRQLHMPPTNSSNTFALYTNNTQTWHIDDNNNLSPDSEQIYEQTIAPSAEPHTYIRSDINGFKPYDNTATFVDGTTFASTIKQLNNPALQWNEVDDVTSVIQWSTEPFQTNITVSSADSGQPIYARTSPQDVSKIELYSPAMTVYLNSSAQAMLNSMCHLNDASFLDSHVKASRATSLFGFFFNTPALTSLSNTDVQNWDTQNCTNFKQMFAYATGFSTLDLSNWDMSNATIASDMFTSCTNLAVLKTPRNIPDTLSIALPDTETGYEWECEGQPSNTIQSSKTYSLKQTDLYIVSLPATLCFAQAGANPEAYYMQQDNGHTYYCAGDVTISGTTTHALQLTYEAPNMASENNSVQSQIFVGEQLNTQSKKLSDGAIQAEQILDPITADTEIPFILRADFEQNGNYSGNLTIDFALQS